MLGYKREVGREAESRASEPSSTLAKIIYILPTYGNATMFSSLGAGEKKTFFLFQRERKRNGSERDE